MITSSAYNLPPSTSIFAVAGIKTNRHEDSASTLKVKSNFVFWEINLRSIASYIFKSLSPIEITTSLDSPFGL